MGFSTLVLILVVVLIGLGLRTIIRDWKKQFAEDDKAAEQKRQAQLERNRKEAKKPGVIELKRGDDGVYRPGND